MPAAEPVDPQPAPAPGPHTDLALRMLYDEQQRLRDELEQLRQKQSQAERQGKDGKGEDGKEDEDRQGGEDKEGEDKEKGGDQKDGKDEKEKDDKEKKPPVTRRIRSWAGEHPFYTTLILAGAVALILGGFLLWRYLESYEDTDDAFIDGHTDPISARISGIVSASYVENTYRVRKGQLLIQLDPRDNQVSKEQAAANYAEAQASVRAQAPNVPITSIDQRTRVVNADFNIVNAEAQVAAAEERHRSAIADLRQAEANQANAAREEERYRLLVEKEEVSREVYDQRATDLRVQTELVASRRDTAEAAAKSVTQAQAQLGTARQQAEQARQDTPRQIAMQRETLAQRKASELAARAQADQSELNLEYTRIYAPADGIIGDKQVQVATQVAPGQEMLALTETTDIWITANFKETEIRHMHPGQSVTVYVDALAQKFSGYVEALPGGTGAVYSLLPPENATGNYVKVVQRLPVRIRLWPGQPNSDRLAPGMSVVPKVWVK